MKEKLIILIIFSVWFTNIVSSQIYNNQQGIKKSSLFSIEKIKIKREPQSFLIGGISMGNPMSVYGMVGYVQKFGFYGKIKTNFNFDSGSDGIINYSYYNNNDILATGSNKGKYSFTGGGLWRISNPLSIYLGLGYGSRWLNWTADGNKSYRLDDYSYSGFVLETGVVYKYKDIFFNLGVQGSGYPEIELGIGIELSKLTKTK